MNPAIAIVGAGLVVPGANSPEEFWRVLLGEEAQFSAPDDRWDLGTLYSPDRAAEDRVYRREMGYVVGFRPHPGTDDRAPEDLDPEAGRWLRHCLAQAAEGVAWDTGDRWSLTVSASPDASQRLEESLFVDRIATLLADDPGDVENVRAALRSYYPLARTPDTYLSPRQAALAACGLLPLESRITVLQGACSGSLQALDDAVRSLRLEECDVAVCASTFVLNRLTNVLCHAMRAAAGPRGVRPFDKEAGGTVFGEGAGALVLKRHDRAVRDGDRVLGVVLGTGASTDGRGTSIVTPNPVGQRLAAERALRDAGVAPEQVRLVVAHGTGTVAGDAAELRMLRDAAGDRARWLVCSNKALIGHTGWTAGIASVVHGILALRHETIPGQRHHAEVVDPGLLRDGVLAVPREDLPWPSRDGSPRIAMVCAYGLGGSNGCAIIGDGAPDPVRARRPRSGSVVVSAWHAHLPGAPDPRQCERWLATGQGSWPDTFPTPYPAPTLAACRLPPATLCCVDRVQQLVLDSAHGLLTALGPGWRPLAERTGVFLAHMGPTKTYVDQVLRAGLDDLCRRVRTGPPSAVSGAGADRLAVRLRKAVPRGISDTYIGLLTCIAASRVAVQHDLHGPSLTFEAGADSMLAAIDAARRQLSSQAIDLALVIAAACNAHHGAALMSGRRDGPLREGAIALALTRHDVAERRDLRRLARVEGGTGAVCDDLPEGLTGFLGADAAVRLLRALVGAGQGRIAPREHPSTPSVVLRPIPRPARHRFFFLRQEEIRTTDHARWLIPLDPDTDSYLADHVVDGRPTMPGTIMLEIAAEAARALVPHLLLRAFEDVEFASFVRLPEPGRRPLRLKADARLTTRDTGAAIVQVEIVSDVVLPGGQVLLTDRRHLSARLRLASLAAQRPFGADLAQPGDDAPQVPDIYLSGGEEHRLSGVFDSLRDLRVHGSGGSARWRPSAGPGHPAFSRFQTPSLLLDALFRTGQLSGTDGPAPHPLVPLGIRNLTLYTLANDVVLGGLFGDEVTLHHVNGQRERRQVALAPDGTVLAEANGLRLLPRPAQATRQGSR